MHRFGADTNVLFSALFFGGRPGELIKFVFSADNELLVSEYIRDELYLVTRRKGLSTGVLENFFALSSVRVVKDSFYDEPLFFSEAKKIVRDKKDWPVFAFAKAVLTNNFADFFVSGDEDLLQPNVKKALNRRLLSVSEALDVVDGRV